MHYTGSCHCGAITFKVECEEITSGVRCNCTMCGRRGATMSGDIIPPENIDIQAEPGALGTYEFGSCVAKHHFCTRCGIYPFHQTMRKPGHYRVNTGCVDGICGVTLPYEVLDMASFRP